MRVAVLASIGCALLVLLVGNLMLHQGEARAQRPAVAPASFGNVRVGQAGELIALASEQADGRQQIVMIDARTQVMSVYHVERSSGLIALKSVRNVSADLRMDEFNSTSPSPKEIRAMLEHR